MTIGTLFYFLAAVVLLVVGLDVVDPKFDAWMVAAGLALLGVVFSGIALPNMVVHKQE